MHFRTFLVTEPRAPRCSRSAHTLGVTGFAARIAGMTGRVVTCARDRTVKVRWVAEVGPDAASVRLRLPPWRTRSMQRSPLRFGSQGFMASFFGVPGFVHARIRRQGVEVWDLTAGAVIESWALGAGASTVALGPTGREAYAAGEAACRAETGRSAALTASNGSVGKTVSPPKTTRPFGNLNKP